MLLCLLFSVSVCLSLFRLHDVCRLFRLLGLLLLLLDNCIIFLGTIIVAIFAGSLLLLLVSVIIILGIGSFSLRRFFLDLCFLLLGYSFCDVVAKLIHFSGTIRNTRWCL